MKWNALMSWPLTLLATAACAGIAVIGMFGYRIGVQWQRSSALLIQRQEEEGARLLVTAISRDMRGAQSALADRDWGDFSSDPPDDVSDLVDAAFSRYPYPESFFSWQEGNTHGATFFNRVNRAPAWMPRGSGASRYPVALVSNPVEGAALRRRIASYAAAHRRYVVFGTRLGDQPYQIIARLTYRDALLEHLQSVTGFTVNLTWVRRAYFSEIISQVARIADNEKDLTLAVFDDQGHLVSGTGDGATRRSFPLLFLDPSAANLDPTSLAIPIWTVRVGERVDSPLLQTRRRGGWTLVVAGVALVALALSLVLVTRAVQASVALSALRSDFVSSVTHDLKTPLASIRILADTLVRRRQLDGETVQTYARLMTQETKRLMRLVDNLLAYSRVTDVTAVYTFEPIAACELVDDVLADFRHQLTEGGFEVAVDVPPDVPLIRGDRTALMLALNNLIDNAIRYSEELRLIQVTARCCASDVILEVRDRGVGIPAEELSSVQRKFVRGRYTRAEGSGMGLAIVNRVVADHDGLFVLESVLGAGTVARVHLPTAGA